MIWTIHLSFSAVRVPWDARIGRNRSVHVILLCFFFFAHFTGEDIGMQRS